MGQEGRRRREPNWRVIFFNKLPVAQNLAYNTGQDKNPADTALNTSLFIKILIYFATKNRSNTVRLEYVTKLDSFIWNKILNDSFYLPCWFTVPLQVPETEEAQTCHISRCQWTLHPYFEQKEVDWFGEKDVMRQNITRRQETRRRRGDCWLVPVLVSTETEGDEAGSNQLLSLLSSAMSRWNSRYDSVKGKEFTEA